MNDLSKDIKILEELLQGAKDNEMYKNNKYFYSIENILKERQADKEKIKNSIPKAKVEEIVNEIIKNKQLAEECIESRIIIADSDSLNYGRREAHNYDINLIQELLKDGGE